MIGNNKKSLNTISVHDYFSLDPLYVKDRVLVENSTRLPNFFICGAAKAGTTSLYNYVRQHPSVTLLDQKEPGYFSVLRPLSNPERYQELFKGITKTQYIGEASTAYLTSFDSALRISRISPNAKIIIILRNPVERAFSLYRWMASEGYEYASTFYSALQLESRRCQSEIFMLNNPEYFYNYLYRVSGLYHKQVKRYIDAFPRKNIMFVLFENLASNPNLVVKNVFDFLGLSDVDSIDTRIFNKGSDVFSPYIEYHIQNKEMGGYAIDGISQYVRVLNRKAGYLYGDYSGLSEELRVELCEWFRTDILETGRLIGQRVDKHWL